MEPTVLIIGGGTFGTSIAYHLAQQYKDPSRVAVVDRESSPPKLAAAIDINRAIRTDYPDPLYCDLAYEAIHPWFWSLELGHFFHKVGWLMLNEEGSDVDERIQSTFKSRGSNCAEVVPLEELSSKWDGVLKDTETNEFKGAYFNPEAGWVNAAGATASFMAAAVKRGVRRITADVIELALDREKSQIQGVRTADGSFLTADQVVLCTGAWTSSILSPIEDALDIPSSDRVEQQAKCTGTVSAYYRLSDAEASRLTKASVPVVVYGGFGEIFPPSGENKLLKVSNSRTTFTNTITTSSGHRISVPCANQSIVPEALKRETEEIMAGRVLQEFTRGKKPEYWRVCYDAQTPTEDLLMCRHPHLKLKNLYLAVGGSFHSYKFMPMIGKYMVNILRGESNGEEKDRAWVWKKDVAWTDVREFGLLSGRTVAKVEFDELESGRAKL